MKLSSPASCLHASNLLTYLSLMAAVAAVASAIHGSARGAGVCIALSVLADTFDGRFARLFARDADRRAFGAQLDSLSDVAAFGIGPAVCLAALSPPQSPTLEWVWWTATFAYAACAITRLGFYNLASEASEDFVGLPVPAAALVWSSALLIGPPPAVAIVLLFATAVAMIAPFRVPRPTGAALATFVLWPVALIVAHLVGTR